MVINTVGEIGKHNFDIAQYVLNILILNKHHSLRKAVIGSIKKWEK